MTTFHVLKVNANNNILEIGLTYLLAVIIEAILKLTEPINEENILIIQANIVKPIHCIVYKVFKVFFYL
jgi:hypothetical protein